VRRCPLVPLLAVPLLLSGCGTQAASSSDDLATTQDAAAGAGLTAVAAVYPFAWLAQQVAPGAEVDLLQGAQEAHDLDLSPMQRAAVETADVVLFTGPIDYQPQVEQAVRSARGAVVSASEVAGEDALLPAAAGAHDHDEEQHGSESDESQPDEPHGEAAHSSAGETPEGEVEAVDPHLWFDPAIMAEVALATGEAFAQADPGEAATYRSNATQVAAQLRSLDSELAGLLGGQCRFDEAIVSHAAYGYLLTPFASASTP
jgi:zinc transport system substrate-binding protein